MDHLILKGPIALRTASTECWKCHAATPVHALIAQAVLDGEADAGADDLCRSFVYDVEEDDMPRQLASALEGLAANYRPTRSRTLGATVWANRCTQCGALQGAFFLHSEPDGPFFGGPDECETAGEERLVAQDNFSVKDASYSL